MNHRIIQDICQRNNSRSISFLFLHITAFIMHINHTD